MSREQFALATEARADVWLQKAAAGQPVTAGERNAFVWQAGAAMDALANPARIITPTGPNIPRTIYRGPVAEWNGREVPLVGTISPPPEWFGKGTVAAPKDGIPRTAGSITWADIVAPNNGERRLLWTATANIMRRLQVEGTVVNREQRPAGRVDAGLPIVPILIVGVAGLISWGLYLYQQSEVVTIRESAETARQAAELQAAQAAWLQRVQAQAQSPTGQIPPPSPAETRVTNRPYPATPAPAERGATDFLTSIQRSATQLAMVGVAGLAVVTVLPPVLANVADRATRGPRA